MNAKNEFEFLNSPIWLDYTQRRYLTVEEIRHRLTQQKQLPSDWTEVARKIVMNRKIGSIPLFLPSVDTKFWFFPSDCVVRKVSEIERLGTALNHQINQQSSFAHEFRLNSTIEEAITSAIYEGAHSARAQAKQLIASGARPRNKDEWMLVNSFEAMKWIQDHRASPVSREVILELHRIVTKNTMEGDEANLSGKFRNAPVFVGSHEGTDYRLIEPAITEAIEVASRNPRYIHPILRGVLLHYFVAYIHPFFDGNGRTARALFYFKAMRNQLEYIQLLSVSAYLKEHGSQYEKAFEKVVVNEMDVTYFVDFCLDSILSAFKAVSEKVSFLLRINDLKPALGLSVNQVGLLQRLALHRFRVISIEEYGSQIGMSREVARQELKALSGRRLVEEMRQGKRHVYRINKGRLDEYLANESKSPSSLHVPTS